MATTGALDTKGSLNGCEILDDEDTVGTQGAFGTEASLKVEGGNLEADGPLRFDGIGFTHVTLGVTDSLDVQ